MNGLANTLVGTAATDVGHGLINVLVGRLGFAFE